VIAIIAILAAMLMPYPAASSESILWNDPLADGEKAF